MLKVYGEVMPALSQCQLSLEVLLRQLESARASEFPHRLVLQDKIRDMEMTCAAWRPHSKNTCRWSGELLPLGRGVDDTAESDGLHAAIHGVALAGGVPGAGSGRQE